MLEGRVDEVILAFMPLILLFGTFLTIMDHVAKVMVWINYIVIQCVMKVISRVDTKIWRKYKKEDFVANKIWKIQMRFQKMDKVNRRRMIAVMIMFMVMWMSYRIMY